MDSFEYNPSSSHKIKASCVNPSLRHVQIENIMAILNSGFVKTNPVTISFYYTNRESKMLTL